MPDKKKDGTGKGKSGKGQKDANSNLWGGRFEEAADDAMLVFGASLDVDMEMAGMDILASMAHARMLAKQGIISADEGVQIIDGLSQILGDLKDGELQFEESDEDIHMAVERVLTERIGEVGKKLHTGRSRNDQVVTDFRLYVMTMAMAVEESLLDLCGELCDLAAANLDVILPGYTHLQKAQPVLFAHHLLAYFWMLTRDIDRFHIAGESAANEMPLGSAALSGATYDLDRESVAETLGFVSVSANSMDGVSNRDFALDFLYAAAVLMMHYSRLCEEIVLWSSDEFGFITLSDAYSTGSSIMPQKKNPDYAELTRGKCGRVYGELMGLLTTMKGLPLAYNKDLQEDKEGLFDACHTVLDCTYAIGGMLGSMRVNKARMLADAQDSFMAATDLADYLVKHGLAFRDAHRVIGNIVHDLEKQQRHFEDLTLAELQGYSDKFEQDALDNLDIRGVVERHDTYGGTATAAVKAQLKEARSLLESYQEPTPEE
jgi:argininosuccinate lyase